MSYPGARMYMLDENGCSETTFEETDHYRVTRDFLLNHPKRLKNLLSKQPLLDLLEQEC
jgi:predicted ATPase